MANGDEHRRSGDVDKKVEVGVKPGLAAEPSPTATSDGTGQGAVGAYTDAEARRGLHLAAMLAHDANSPLAAILVGLEMIEEEADQASGDLRELVGHAQMAGRRLARLLRQLHRVARAPGAYALLELPEVLAHFDARRLMPTDAGDPGRVTLMADAALLAVALAELGAHFPSMACKVSYSPRGVRLAGARAGLLPLPDPGPYLVACGAELTEAEGVVALLLPYRLIPT
jgi:signal transduction histidine kinase